MRRLREAIMCMYVYIYIHIHYIHSNSLCVCAMVKRWRMVYGHLTIGISDKGYINPYEWMTIHPDGHIIQLCPWHPRKCPAIQKKIQLACPNMFNQYQLGCTFESGWIYHDIIQKGKVVWGSNPFSWIFMLNGGLFLMFHEGLSQCVAITVTLKIWPVRLETNRAWSFVDLHRRWSNICASDLPKSIIYIYIYIYIWYIYIHMTIYACFMSELPSTSIVSFSPPKWPTFNWQMLMKPSARWPCLRIGYGANKAMDYNFIFPLTWTKNGALGVRFPKCHIKLWSVLLSHLIYVSGVILQCQIWTCLSHLYPICG